VLVWLTPEEVKRQIRELLEAMREFKRAQASR
jgi:hypothetical protein